MSLNVKNVDIEPKNCKNERRQRNPLNAQSVLARQLRSGRRAQSTSRAADGCRKTNKMDIHVNMQGWYAVIVGDKVVAAFVEYEDALVYRKTIQTEGAEIIIERIDHRNRKS